MPRLGVEGRLVIAFTMAGGLVASGIVVATVTLSGNMSLSAALPATWLVFAAGAVLGWVHAVLLGFVGRQKETDRGSVVRHMLFGGVCSLPGLLIALFAASGITLSGILVRAGGAPAMAAAALCWLLVAGICTWGLVVGIEAFRNACIRFPELRFGSVLLGILLITLVFVFERSRPEIWGTHYRVTSTGAVLLAFGVTVWLGAPLLLVLLHLFRRTRAALS